MIVADLAPEEIDRSLRHAGLRLRIGPVVAKIRSRHASLRDGLALHYGRHSVEPDSGFADFHVNIEPARGLWGWARRQVVLDNDNVRPMAPLPADHAFALLERGLDWCISSHCHQYLIVRAAVVARGDQALLLPAPPGAGKSTLCGGLAFGGGWRVLSDEFALVVPGGGQVLPLERPICLKNHSIDVLHALAPSAVFGAEMRDAATGRVAFASPPAQRGVDSQGPATPAWIVVPRYEAGAATRLDPRTRARAFMSLADNAFNYDVHGRAGFDSLARVIDHCQCHDLTYSSLPEAIETLDHLAHSGA